MLADGTSIPMPIKWHKQRVLRQTFDSRCAFITGSNRFTTLDAFICAGDIEDEQSCQGDDGSPFVCFDRTADNHYAAGIVSFSGGCGKDIGSQYTKLRPYINWIENNAPSFDVAVQRGMDERNCKILHRSEVVRRKLVLYQAICITSIVTFPSLSYVDSFLSFANCYLF